MSRENCTKNQFLTSVLLVSRLEKTSIVWIGRIVDGDQCIGHLPVEMLEGGVDLDQLVDRIFADLGIADGELSLRFFLPSGDLVEVSADNTAELGPEVMDVTFTGEVPSWLTGRWVP